MKLRSYSLREIRSGMNVLVRIDGNVPLKNGRIVRDGDRRLRVLIPELRALVKKGAEVTLMTHIGRPSGKVDPELSVKPVEQYMKKNVSKTIQVKENLRFSAGEEKDASPFAKQLASGFDLYINDAFGVCHRKHASVHAIGKYIDARAGRRLVEEVKQLSKAYRHPSVLVLGGIKLETKIPVIEHLSSRVDHILTAGGIAVAMTGVITGKKLYAGGYEISDTEKRMAKKVLSQYGDQIHVPLDYLFSRAKDFRQLAKKHMQDVRSGDRLFDIGPETIKEYESVLRSAKTVVWNGPMGFIERVPSSRGTQQIAEAIVANRWSRKIVGGGDTVAYLDKKDLAKQFSFVSTGGGAMLAFLGGKPMPGLEILRK